MQYEKVLQFTGNWFIDAGIIGFVNLMEEVYGWDLNKLKEKIYKNPKLVYYGYFPFAYLFYHSKIRGTFKKLSNVRKEKSNSIEKELKLLEKEKMKFQKEVDVYIQRILDDANKQFNNVKNLISNLIIGFDLNFPEDHRNFFLYNPKKNLFESFVYLYYLLKEDFKELLDFASKISKTKAKKGLSYEVYPDSTINPFLYSPEKFSNIGYTLPLTLEKIKKGLKLDIPIYLILLSFFNAFQFIGGKRILFYVNNLEVCYNINKRLKTKMEMLGEKKSIFQVTWSSIIDELTENKAKFSLENMYLIEFEGIENQKLKGVEYIGIPKLQASILLEDTIREVINTNIQIEKDRQIWLLEEFIKNKPLYLYILQHIWLRINSNGSPTSKKALLYSLAIDAEIKSFGDPKQELFSKNFFRRHIEVVSNIKHNFEKLHFATKNISEIFNKEDRENILYPLYSAIKKRNKIAFVNILLKNFLQKGEQYKKFINYLNRYIFRNIINNDSNWENYALAIIIGLIYGGKTIEEDAD